jgi:hypothetical protein
MLFQDNTLTFPSENQMSVHAKNIPNILLNSVTNPIDHIFFNLMDVIQALVPSKFTVDLQSFQHYTRYHNIQIPTDTQAITLYSIFISLTIILSSYICSSVIMTSIPSKKTLFITILQIFKVLCSRIQPPFNTSDQTNITLIVCIPETLLITWTLCKPTKLFAILPLFTTDTPHSSSTLKTKIPPEL